MADFYDVRTPLGDYRCESGQEVSQHVALYMKTPGASLNQVTVVRVPDTGATTTMGEELSPSLFWP